MVERFSRREFLKAAGLWAAASALPAGLAVLSGQPFAGPRRQPRRGSSAFEPLDWETAVQVVRDAIRRVPGSEIAFLLGLFPDHLADLLDLLASGMAGTHLRGAQVARYSIQAELEGRVTLMDAAQKFFGTAKVPVFDFQRADLVFTFGVNFSESWLVDLPSVAGGRVDISSLQSPASAAPGEWVPVRPGSEGWVALALALLVARSTGQEIPPTLAAVDLRLASEASGLPQSVLRRLSQRFARAERKAAVPGALALAASGGLAAGEAVLALNVVSGSLGRPGGLWLPLEAPLYPHLPHRPGTLAEIAALIGRMQSGQIQLLFLHGVDPLAELPEVAAREFAAALEAVPLVISFAPASNATSRLADYVLPDRSPLESWGYQKHRVGDRRLGVSGFQPLRAPPHPAPSTADLLLAASADPDFPLPFDSEMAFLRHAAAALDPRPGAWDRWLRSGGWWASEPVLEAPTLCTPLALPLDLQPPPSLPADELLLLPGSPASGEAVDVEIHPQAARRLGFRNGAMACLSTEAGSLEAQVRLSPAVHPTAAAVPSAAALSHLLELNFNESGNLAFGARLHLHRL